MDTSQVLKAIARFLDQLGYESAEGGGPTADSVQATIESLAGSLEDEPGVLQVGAGGVTLSREEGEGGPPVARIGFFDVELERLEKDSRVILTRLSIRQPSDAAD